MRGHNDIIGSTSSVIGSHKDTIVNFSPANVQQSQSIGEVDIVLSNVETCLAPADMMENITAAKKNAEYFLSVLRRVIPRNYNNTYRSPCWQMDFHATLLPAVGANIRMGNVTSSHVHRGL